MKKDAFRNWFKKYWPFIRKGLGVCLILGAAFAGYWWYYKLAPVRRHSDYRWKSMHSAKALWKEEQKMYHRAGRFITPCPCQQSRIGYYGNKQWCLLLIDSIVLLRWRRKALVDTGRVNTPSGTFKKGD